ncbi:CoA-binding protein [Psychroflexus tropicus]|uniref:CoA-binding protein n=1 Tax=Psychroflexus tropicus TaxID=197345 RepID=UPI0003816767|nr:CoA-binding protein [Psychroflexus tropicus]
MKDRTLVIGASENPNRYSYKAIIALLNKGYKVLAVGKRKGEVEGVKISTQISTKEEVDTVTLYINPSHQEEYESFLLKLKPKRVIFNPGTENPALKNKLELNGIKISEACTLILLASNQY